MNNYNNETLTFYLNFQKRLPKFYNVHLYIFKKNLVLLDQVMTYFVRYAFK